MRYEEKQTPRISEEYTLLAVCTVQAADMADRHSKLTHSTPPYLVIERVAQQQQVHLHCVEQVAHQRGPIQRVCAPLQELDVLDGNQGVGLAQPLHEAVRPAVANAALRAQGKGTSQ